MYESLATLLEAFVLRDAWPGFLAYRVLFVASSSVDLTPKSHRQPPGISPRLFRLHPATKHQELSTQHKSPTTTSSAARAQKLRKLHRVCWWFRPGTFFRLRKETAFNQPGQSHGNDSIYTDRINYLIRVSPMPSWWLKCQHQ